MTRNTEKRVEVACPIIDPDCKEQVMNYFEDQWKDNVKTRIMQADGTYEAVESMDEAYDYQDAYTRKEVVIKEEKSSWIKRIWNRKRFD